MGEKYKKGWSDEEVGVECVPVPEPIPEEKEEEHEVQEKEKDVDVMSYVTKIAHQSAVQFQVLESTVNGTQYIVVPLMYFNMKPEEIVLLDDCALIPFIKQE